MTGEERRERAIERVDQEFGERVARLLERHATAESLLDIPAGERAKLFAWRTRQYREAWGRDPKTGELTPAEKKRRREALDQQREGEPDAG